MIALVRVFFQSREELALEVLSLRQQAAVLKRRHPGPVLNSLDRLCWTTLRRFWPRWSDVLVIVKPETVHRFAPCGFQAVLALAITPAPDAPKSRVSCER